MSDNRLNEDSKRERFSSAAYALVVVASLALGAGVLLYLYLTRPTPQGNPEADAGRLVRVFEAKPTTHRLRIDAYGTTRASEVWTAIAEVRGEAEMVDSQFEPGELLPVEVLLVQIDRTDYELAMTRSEAEKDAKEAQLKELDENKRNLEKILPLREQQLNLAKNEYDREAKVFAKNVVSRSTLEAAENAYVTAITAAQETRNNLALIQAQRVTTEALVKAAEAQWKQAKRDYDKCDIRLPMAARCISKSVEENQYVTVGERLGAFLSLDMTEVVAMVEARKMRSLFPKGIKTLGKLDFADTLQGQSLPDLVQVPVEVHWGLGDLRSVWYGRVARIGSSLDPGTRTVPVIVEVPHPYKDVQPGIRPPLVPDVFCEVTFYGATVHDVFVIPRDALRDDRVYLLRDGKLRIQSVTVLAREKEDAVISEGIEPGDMVILTDLFPASEGMPLRGEVVASPVKPQEKANFPKDLFKRSAKEKSRPDKTDEDGNEARDTQKATLPEPPETKKPVPESGT